MNFILIKQNGSLEWWRLKRNGKLENPSGSGFIPRTPPDIIESVEVDEWEDLDWTKTLIDKESRLGWLSPSGRWYPCQVWHHEQVAYWILKKEESELKAWVKIFRDFDNKEFVYGRLLTAEQKNWLGRNGYTYD